MRVHHTRLSPAARSLLLGTSGVLFFAGFVVYDMGDEWWKTPHHLRAKATRGVELDTLRLAYSSAFLQLGMDAMLVGSMSTLNYLYYTGRPTPISVLDFLACLWGGARFMHLSWTWLFKGNIAMLAMLAWCVGTICIYVFRKHPNEQIAVHAAGIGGLVCWVMLAFAHRNGVLPHWPTGRHE